MNTASRSLPWPLVIGLCMLFASTIRGQTPVLSPDPPRAAEPGPPSPVPDDPAFARFVDLSLLGDAWLRLDSQLLTDVALQLMHGEQMLGRPYRAMKMDTFCLVVTRLAVDNRDVDSVQRLKRGAERCGKKDLAERLTAAESLLAASRSVAAEHTVPVDTTTAEQYALYKKTADGLRSLAALGKRSELLAAKHELASVTPDELTAAHVQSLTKLADSMLANLPAAAVPCNGPCDELTSVLERLAAESRAGLTPRTRHAGRQRIIVDDSPDDEPAPPQTPTSPRGSRLGPRPVAPSTVHPSPWTQPYSPRPTPPSTIHPSPPTQPYSPRPMPPSTVHPSPWTQPYAPRPITPVRPSPWTRPVTPQRCQATLVMPAPSNPSVDATRLEWIPDDAFGSNGNARLHVVVDNPNECWFRVDIQWDGPNAPWITCGNTSKPYVQWDCYHNDPGHKINTVNVRGMGEGEVVFQGTVSKRSSLIPSRPRVPYGPYRSALQQLSAGSRDAGSDVPPPSARIVYNYRQDRFAVRVAQGGTLEVVVPDNPSTGCQWRWSPQPDANLQLLGIERIKRRVPIGRIGAPEADLVYLFEVLGSGEAVIEAYRPWNDEVARDVRVYVTSDTSPDSEDSE